MCNADSSLEPAGRKVEGFLGWGVRKQCRDYDSLKVWAERWRVMDRHGFTPKPLDIE